MGEEDTAKEAVRSDHGRLNELVGLFFPIHWKDVSYEPINLLDESIMMGPSWSVLPTLIGSSRPGSLHHLPP